MAEMSERELLLYGMLDLWSRMLFQRAQELGPEAKPEYEDWLRLAVAAEEILRELEVAAHSYDTPYQREFAVEHLIFTRGTIARAMSLMLEHQRSRNQPAPVVPNRE